MKDILLVCPQERDLQAIRSAGLGARYRIHCAGADLDAIDDFDPKSFIEECDAIPADGVVGTKDRSALIAALIAERRGLPGPKPARDDRMPVQADCRALQRATVPAATPVSRSSTGARRSGRRSSSSRSWGASRSAPAESTIRPRSSCSRTSTVT